MPAPQKTVKSYVRIPPQDVEVEKALLGSIMLKPATMIDVVDVLSPEAFYADKHALIYRNILELYSKGEPIDIVSLSSRLREKGQTERAGGSSYLAELTSIAPSFANAEQYAKIIQKKHLLRSLIDAAGHISELGYDEIREIDEILDCAEKKVCSIGSSYLGSNKFISIKNTLDEAWERLDKLSKSDGQIRGVPTGFRALDNKLSGLQKSDLIILAARPSMGKTSLALDIARQAALKHGITVGIFSLEMSSQQLVDRMFAAESGVDSWRLRTGKIKSDEDFLALRGAMERISQAPIFIDDEASNNIIRMRSVARRLKNDHDLGLIIVDYLQLMVPNKNSDSLVQQVTEISRSLKAFARELDVPVLALSQLNRNVESRGGEPRLSDLRDSGSIEQDADVVMFIHRDDKYDKNSAKPNVAKIIIAKHRNGPTGFAELFFDDKRTSFMDIDEGNYNPTSKAEFGDF